MSSAVFSAETPQGQSETLARENLRWYCFSITKHTDIQRRMRGWRIVVNMLSEPTHGEVITGTAKDGNLIIDRTHHMRTIKTQKNGNNALFELRDAFAGDDVMFVEYISEAYKQCSFTVPHPKAFQKLMSVTQRINTWAVDREGGSSEATPATTIVPHFRIEIPAVEFDERSSVMIANVGFLVSWENILRDNSQPFNVDIILRGQSPNLGWAYWVLKNSVKVRRKAPRVQFDNTALKERFQSIVGTGLMVIKARQAYKALVASQLLTRSTWGLDEGKRKDLISKALSFSEGSQMLQMCHVWEVDGDQFDSTVAEWGDSSSSEASETEATESESTSSSGSS